MHNYFITPVKNGKMLMLNLFSSHIYFLYFIFMLLRKNTIQCSKNEEMDTQFFYEEQSSSKRNNINIKKMCLNVGTYIYLTLYSQYSILFKQLEAILKSDIYKIPDNTHLNFLLQKVGKDFLRNCISLFLSKLHQT